MLNISNLTAGYGNTLILDAINLKAEAGKVHGILGVNGAGKTTFFKALCRLGPAFSGEVTSAKGKSSKPMTKTISPPWSSLSKPRYTPAQKQHGQKYASPRKTFLVFNFYD